MIVTRTNIFVGEASMEIPLSKREIEIAEHLRDQGWLVQDAYPTLTDEQREFMMTGITPELWAQIMSEEEQLLRIEASES